MLSKDLESFICTNVCVYIGDYMYTTVRVEQKTKEKLEASKNYDREPLNSVIGRLIENASDEEITDDEIKQIEAGLKNIKEGKYKTLEDAEKEWGI